ncbi:MAG: hypothetical protein DU489_15670 [Nitrosomonas sp.]|uniref:hypothetical protein n=1 Tax=Nitrosomonas sp. TaxID=42353 RepID=UPI0032EBAFEA
MKQTSPIEPEKSQACCSNDSASNSLLVHQTFTDNRESAAIQRQLKATMANSSQAIAQRQVSRQMNSSERLLAQRKMISGVSDKPEQLGEASLQGRFTEGYPLQRVKHNPVMQLQSVIQRKAVVVDLNKVQALDSSDKIELKDIYSRPTFKISSDAKGKRGYIGTAIVWSGESDAASLANKYIEGSQEWNSDERKARLGVNFLINSRAEFDLSANDMAEFDAKAKTIDTALNVLGKATSRVEGTTWGYRYKGGGLPEKNTTEVGETLASGKLNATDTVTWKKGNETLNATEATKEFKDKRAEKGVPYGALRSKVGKGTAEIENHLKSSNKTGEVYLHSIDADAPDFSTLIPDKKGGWLNVLDAYDQVLEGGGDHDFVIGGYNLIAEPEQYKGLNSKQDFRHTVRANVVDMTIRQAAFSVEPTLIYPTEPNFLVKASTYTEIDTSTGQKNAWGNRASEGRALLDNYIKMKKDKTDITYNPLASVPTGVGAGGARLKIDSAKKYDENSLYGKPQGDTSVKDDAIGIPQQYVVQAQSWAGATRIAGAYFAAYTAKLGKQPTFKKTDIVKYFAPVEKMVMALAQNNDPAGISLVVEGLVEHDLANTSIKIQPILKAIQEALAALHTDIDFARLLNGN